MLIEKEKTLKAISSIKKLTIEQKDGLEAAKLIVSRAEAVEAIPIDWLHKQLIEMMYQGEIRSDQITTYHKLIGRWKNKK